MTTWLAGMQITADRLNDNQHYANYAGITANTATTTTVETVGITTGSITFTTGRAYRITIKGLVQSSILGDTVTVRVRKTDLSGAVYIDQVRTYISANNANAPVHFSNICTNTTGADVAAVLVGTFVRASGTGNVFIAASSTSPAFVSVEEVGSSDDFSGATAIA